MKRMMQSMSRIETLAVITSTETEFSSVVKELGLEKQKNVSGKPFFCEQEVCSGKMRVAIVYAGSTGKVAAASATQSAIERYKPFGIVCVGTAGALRENMTKGDIMIADRVLQGDKGIISSKGFIHTGPIAGSGLGLFSIEDHAVDVMFRDVFNAAINKGKWESFKSKIFKGVLITCDQFIAKKEVRLEMAERYGGLAVDMEAAAIAQVCESYNIPFIAIKAISDEVGDEIEGFEKTIRRRSQGRFEHRAEEAKLFCKSPDTMKSIVSFGRSFKSASNVAAKSLGVFVQELNARDEQ